ncbi:hypothetical protein BC831DRAFT_478372 [Entophlyctis helioformis]|nr:hypothetical protein BC831DRAFT_478372 [Entophlyctis helioformis]
MHDADANGCGRISCRQLYRQAAATPTKATARATARATAAAVARQQPNPTERPRAARSRSFLSKSRLGPSPPSRWTLNRNSSNNPNRTSRPGKTSKTSSSSRSRTSKDSSSSSNSQSNGNVATTRVAATATILQMAVEPLALQPIPSLWPVAQLPHPLLSRQRLDLRLALHKRTAASSLARLRDPASPATTMLQHRPLCRRRSRQCSRLTAMLAPRSRTRPHRLRCPFQSSPARSTRSHRCWWQICRVPRIRITCT